jgi:hypothetical protein
MNRPKLANIFIAGYLGASGIGKVSVLSLVPISRKVWRRRGLKTSGGSEGKRRPRRGYQATLAGILPNGRQPAVDDSRDPNTVQCVQTPPCYPIDLRRRWHRWWRRRDHGGGFQILSLRPAPCRPHRAGPLVAMLKGAGWTCDIERTPQGFKVAAFRGDMVVYGSRERPSLSFELQKEKT